MAYATLDSPYLTATTYSGRKKTAAGPSLAPFATGLLGDDGPMRGGYRQGAHRSEGQQGGGLPPGVTQAMVDASLAANPNASKGGYGGPPMGAQYAVPGDQAGGADPTLDGSHADTTIDSDPALVQIRAANTRNLGQAQAAALEGRRKALQDFGDPLLAKSLLGENDPTLASISSDPDSSTSVLARLARSYRDRTKQNEEELNQGNLFYSGYRGNVLKGIAQDRATDTADATSNVQSALGMIGAALLKAQNDAADAEASGVIAAGARHQGEGDPTPPGGGAPPDTPPAPPAGADTGGGGFRLPAPPDERPGSVGPTVPPAPADLPADAALAAFLDDPYANRVKRYGNR